jgi:hypothetical protein
MENSLIEVPYLPYDISYKNPMGFNMEEVVLEEKINKSIIKIEINTKIWKAKETT